MASNGQVALVMGEGTSAVVGCAKRLAREGASLALYTNASKSPATGTAKLRDGILEMKIPGVKVTIHPGHLGTAAAVEKLFADVVAEHGKIDIVVNSAGAMLQKPDSSVSPVEYNKMFAYAVFVDEQRRITVDELHAEANRM